MMRLILSDAEDLKGGILLNTGDCGYPVDNLWISRGSVCGYGFADSINNFSGEAGE